MRKDWKRNVAAVMLAMMAVMTAGCGNKEEVAKEEVPEFLYVADFESLEIPEGGYVDRSKLLDGTFYYNYGIYDEETGTYTTTMAKQNLADGSKTEMPLVLAENENMQTFTPMEDGSIAMVTSAYVVENEDYENAKETYYVKVLDESGNCVKETNITELLDQADHMYFQFMEVDEEGNIYLPDGEQSIYVLNPQGEMLFQLSVDGWVNAMGKDDKGNVMVTCYGQDGLEMRVIDLATKGWGETYTGLPSGNGNNSTMIPAGENKMILSSGNSLVKYDLETKESEEILNWINCDINTDNVIGVGAIGADNYVALIQDYMSDEYSVEIATLNKVAYDSVTPKTELTYGTMYVDQSIKEEIIKFNKTNDTYRIIVKEYGGDDYEASVMQLNADIVSGNGTDIVDLSGNSDFKQYVAKGVLEDLNPYLTADSELASEEFVESVMNAYTIEDKLYGVVPSFSISGFMGKKSVLGEGTSWTIDDLMGIMDEQPEDVKFFDYATRDSVFSMLTYSDMGSYVNWETGECTFNTDSFKKVLEFANRFPKDTDYEAGMSDSTAEYLQNGQLLTTQVYLDGVQSYQMHSMMFGEDVVCKGFPSEGEGGLQLQVNQAIGMNAKSEQKEGAWEFLRILLTSEYQNGDRHMWGFPTNCSVMDAKFKEDMTPEMGVDENGEEIEVPKTSWGWNDFNADIYAATQEEVDTVKSYIDGAVLSSSFDQEIYKILSEESASYFQGQKSVDEVADIIQSRTSIYVSENR